MRPPPPELRLLEAGALQRLADVYDQLNDPIAAEHARATSAELKRALERGFGYPGSGPKRDGGLKKDTLQFR